VDAIIGLVELFEYNSLFARQICRVECAMKMQAYDAGLRRDNGAHSTGGDSQQPKYGLREILFFAAVGGVICLVEAPVMLGY
jgi:hypothetical protein